MKCKLALSFLSLAISLQVLLPFLIKKLSSLSLVPLAVSFLVLPPFLFQTFPIHPLKEMNWKNMLSCQKEAIVNSHRQTLLG